MRNNPRLTRYSVHSEAAGIEFTNGDQPGVRLTKAAAARSAEPGSAQIRRVAAKGVRGETAKANEKKR